MGESQKGANCAGVLAVERAWLKGDRTTGRVTAIGRFLPVSKDGNRPSACKAVMALSSWIIEVRWLSDALDHNGAVLLAIIQAPGQALGSLFDSECLGHSPGQPSSDIAPSSNRLA